MYDGSCNNTLIRAQTFYLYEAIEFGRQPFRPFGNIAARYGDSVQWVAANLLGL